MIIQFKAWNKIKKEMVYPSKDKSLQVGQYYFRIDLNGTFSVSQGVHTFAGTRLKKRKADHFDLLFSIGLTDSDGRLLFPGDYIQDPDGKRLLVQFGFFKGSKDSWGVEACHHGAFICFEGGEVYALTQNGTGYSLASEKCVFIEHENEIKK